LKKKKHTRSEQDAYDQGYACGYKAAIDTVLETCSSLPAETITSDKCIVTGPPVGLSEIRIAKPSSKACIMCEHNSLRNSQLPSPKTKKEQKT
jgi:hypothetical protein